MELDTCPNHAQGQIIGQLLGIVILRFDDLENGRNSDTRTAQMSKLRGLADEAKARPQETYRDPVAKRPTTAIFWPNGSLILETSYMGRARMMKSIEEWVTSVAR